MPVTNWESPEWVAMNPSRLCPRWPTVIRARRRGTAHRQVEVQQRRPWIVGGKPRLSSRTSGDQTIAASGGTDSTRRSCAFSPIPNAAGRRCSSSSSACALTARTTPGRSDCTGGALHPSRMVVSRLARIGLGEAGAAVDDGETAVFLCGEPDPVACRPSSSKLAMKSSGAFLAPSRATRGAATSPVRAACGLS